MLSKSSNTRSFQEVLADLRTTRIGTGLPSPAEILHGRNLTTRAQAEIDIKAIRSVLQERQLKMMLDHNTSRRSKKARPLVVGERCHVLGPGNQWIDAFMTGITDSGRSYETQVEATGKQLMRNRSHINQEALTYHTCMLLSYSEKWSLQQPVMEMHRLREKTRSFQQTVREISNKPIHLRS